jgi:hypothetical protein
MALFDPQKLFGSLVSAMGLTPADVVGFVNEVASEVRAIRAERVAFKAACQKTVPDILARLERIEALLSASSIDPGAIARNQVPGFDQRMNEHVRQLTNGGGGDDTGGG